MSDIDVTDKTIFGNNDDELLYIVKCSCGEAFDNWDFIISIYRDDAYKCPSCKRKFYFKNSIKIYQVNDQNNSSKS